MEDELIEEVNQEKEFRFVGLSRSGNHAVINWVIDQIEGKYCFLNCTEPKRNPFLTARPLTEGGKVYRTNIKNFDLAKEQKGERSMRDYLIYSHEDCFLGSLNKKKWKETEMSWKGRSRERKDVLILRDPFNLFASRIKSGLLRGHYTHHGVKPISLLTLRRIYKQHEREFLGEKNYLKNKVVINFNLWTTDKEYRRSLCEKLEIPFSDKGFREVAEVAGGSSFDGTRFSGSTDKMDLHSRWKEYATDEEYWAMFDTEMVELAIRIFGNIPAVQYRKQNIETDVL